MRGWGEVISESERDILERLVFAKPIFPSAWDDPDCAADILRCVNAGVMPPQESIDWFVRRFRSEP
jgi:hypothetical protein